MSPEQSSGPAKLQLTREYIDVCVDEDGYFEIGLGSVTTQNGNYKEDKAELNSKVDALLEVCGIEPARWLNHMVELDLSNLSSKPRSGRRVRAKGEKRSAGIFIHDYTYDDMPMEWGDLDGESNAILILAIDAKTHLKLIGNGTYWRERFYLEMGQDREDVLRQIAANHPNFDPDRSEQDTFEEPGYLGYEDGHRISFIGRVVLAPDEAEPA